MDRFTFLLVTLVGLFAGILIGALAMSGPGVDRGQCLESHIEDHMVMTPVMAGKTMTMIPTFQARSVCDRWEFPDGRKSHPPL